MKKLVLIFILFATINTTFAQKKDEIKEFFWGQNDNFKKANTVPEKWKNESAVMILKYEFASCSKFQKETERTGNSCPLNKTQSS